MKQSQILFTLLSLGPFLAVGNVLLSTPQGVLDLSLDIDNNGSASSEMPAPPQHPGGLTLGDVEEMIAEGSPKISANWSEELIRQRIPVRDPLYIVIPISVIYSLILLSGLIGNISTCIVIAKNNYMHTATNYYLFSLAISDLLLLVSGLPQEMYLNFFKYPYIFGDIFCLGRGLASETSANASVLTIAAFTIERYVAICHPLRSHKWSQLSRVVKAVLVIWFLAFALAIPQAAQFGVVDEVDTRGHIIIPGAWCSIKREIFPFAFQISIFVMFVFPMTIIAVLYILIGLKLRSPRAGGINRSQDLSVEPRSTSRASQKRVIHMLEACSAAFFICWFPFHLQRLMAIYAAQLMGGQVNDTFLTVYKVINYLSGILYFASTCINPILYHIMSNKFRQAFRDTIRKLFGNSRDMHHHRTFSSHTFHGGSSIRSNRYLLPQQYLLNQQRRNGGMNGNGNGNGGGFLNGGEGSPLTQVVGGQCINCARPSHHCLCRGQGRVPNHTGGVSANGGNGNGHAKVGLTPFIPLDCLEKSQGRKWNEAGTKRIGGLRAFFSGGNGGCSRKSRSRAASLKKGPARNGRRGSGGSGGVEDGGGVVRSPAKRAASHTSVDSSRSNNTISNTSLQDLETEYTGEELASILASEMSPRG